MKVSSLHIYPVKSMQGVTVDEFAVTEKGPQHDRLWMVTDENYRFLTQRQISKLATIKTHIADDGALVLTLGNGRSHTIAVPGHGDISQASVWKDDVAVFDAGEDAAEALSGYLGKTCRLVYQAPNAQRMTDPEYGQEGDHVSLADGFPILITNVASLTALNLPEDITMDRFRANIVLDGLKPFEEDDIRVLKIGDVELELVKPCARCVVTTQDQKSGERVTKEPIATLVKLRRGTKGAYFGQNAVPRQLGTIKAGDKVEIVSRRSAEHMQLVPVQLKFAR